MSQYLGIRSEGALIPLDLFDRIAQEQEPGQQAKDFGLVPTARLTDEIARAWSDAQDYWHIFQRRAATLDPADTGTTITREKWVQPLLSDLLGYKLTFQAAGAQVGGRTYPISHRAGAGEESPPVHIEGRNVSLDERQPGRRLSPQALVQEYLNVTDEHLWGVVTNGLRLRLLRDTSRTSRPSYLEFDLESIVEGNHFNEFILFYRLCHRSRLPKTKEDSPSCWLEKYFQEGVEQGGRVRNKLRDGVEEALTVIGTGLLRQPDNTELRERVQSGRLTAVEMHRQLLRLVYRLLFLMVAEERHMIVPESPQAERRHRLYDRYYSVGRLRELAEKAVESSSFCDLWVGLQRTFALFEDTNDSNALGIPPLNGDLFGPLAIRDIQKTSLYNDDLIVAMRRLSLFREEGAWRRINYKDLNVEELGSVYESLLDFQPVIKTQSDAMTFSLATGSERKSTGSYYTRPELVRELIESALVPVMEDRLKQAKETEAKEQALLSMTVCDPACGSGHFLLAAARRLARELAKVRTGEDEPTPEHFHLAVRDVISHCIYGVDVNPLAVDLCKLALWLEGHWTGKPLSFLDHRIKCGNSLIGVLDPNVLKDGISDAAFTAVTGDDKKVAQAFKKRNKEESKGRYLPFSGIDGDIHQFAAGTHDIDEMVEDTPADVKRKQQKYEEWRSKPDWWHDWTACNIWTAAFLVPLKEVDDPAVPTYDKFVRYLEGGHVDGQMEGLAIGLSTELKFFHWTLEFPEVFEKGGFDVVLGNPPWDSLQPEELTFFATHGDGSIARMSGAKRKQAIAALKKDNPGLLQRWENEKRRIEAANKFIRESKQLSLTTSGKLNTYSLFAELSARLHNSKGYCGVLVPSGIVVDETNGPFVRQLINDQTLRSCYDFENREKLFSEVDSRMRFALLTTSRNCKTPPVLAYFLTRADQLHDARRRFTFNPDDVHLLNPLSHVLPIFRAVTDYALTKKLYSKFGCCDPSVPDSWSITLKQGLFNMTSDSHLFADEPKPGYVPLYEGKMVQAYDHRAASIVVNRANVHRQAQPELTTDAQHTDPDYQPTPHYWVSLDEVESGLLPWRREWVMAFKDVTAATNDRTAIGTVIPRFGAGHNLPLILFDATVSASRSALLLANLNALPFDYIVRQKMGGNHLTFGIFRQLAFVPPQIYSPGDECFVSSRVLELIYTSSDMTAWAEDCGYRGKPFRWNDLRRAEVKAELDAYYAHLYGLTPDEVRYILDPKDVFGEGFPSETFRVLKEREIKEYGEYRTQRLVLEAFDKLADSPRFRDEMPNRVSAFEAPK